MNGVVHLADGSGYSVAMAAYAPDTPQTLARRLARLVRAAATVVMGATARSTSGRGWDG